MNIKKQRIIAVVLITAMVIAAIPILIPTSKADAKSDWTLVTNGRALKAYPTLQEYIWQKNANMAPNGPYDKIGLHRLIKADVTPKGVIVMLPGTYGSGEMLTSNPTTDNWTLTENESQAIYWANRNYDVYAMDYRTHFVPDNLNPLPPASINSTQLSFMANWGWDQWMSDINEVVNKAKIVSSSPVVFLAGMSFGGRATMNYATIYPQNLRGIILLDGGNASANTAPTNQYNLTAALAQENAAQTWFYLNPNLPGSTPLSPSFKYLGQYALANPGAPNINPFTNTPFGFPVNPLTGKPFANITDSFGFLFQYAGMTNITGGNMNTTTLVRFFATMDMFWPDRINLEYNAYMGWNNCPYVTKDFDDNFKNVNIPLIGFTSQNYGLPKGGPIGNIANADVTRTLLKGYGHIDVFEGIYSSRDISEPVYQWLLNHTLSASIMQGTAATIETRSSITLVANASGGPMPYTYQWFQDASAIVGQILPQINVGWTFAGTHTLYCIVNDSMQTTSTTAPFTLTVVQTGSTPSPLSTQMPTQAPSQRQTTTPTTQPTTSPTANPTLTPASTSSLAPDTAQGNNNIPFIIVAILVVAAIGFTAFAIKRKK